MVLSWNEIKTRAEAFVSEWQDKAVNAREEADAAEFMLGFLNIFGNEGRKKAIREYPVHLGTTENLLFGESPGSEQKGYIDLLWKGKILIEMKSPGKDLSKAYEQAKRYADGLSGKDFPQGIVACDFCVFRYYDFSEELGLAPEMHEFALAELPEYVTLFGHLAGYTEIRYKSIDPVNIEAAEKMGNLHDRLKAIGYSGHQLELYLVRLLFCLFADDTGIFEPPDLFITYILQRTNPDGSDLAPLLQKIFETLNKPKEKRLKTIDEQLNQFPYINGKLFEELIDSADFDSKMRDTLIDCCKLDWSKISPAIFGAMFQSVMSPEKRHDIGAHYTSERNILKLIHPLFLDGLREEFESIKKLSPSLREERLKKFHEKLAHLKFLDPACGCGNFLVISYRELRLLEIEVIALLLGKERSMDILTEVKVNVHQFYGIEIEEFPAQIAQTAMWLTDHQMNLKVSETFGRYFVRIPLTAAASIHNTNALTTDWESIVPKEQLSYILGNPPFLGARVMDKTQKSELLSVFENMKDCSNLDYVTCWYKKAARYIQETNIEVAFVSTNSICQGEQVAVLWPELMNKHGVKINFAHQTFKWWNEASGKAAVFCVIVGFSLSDRKEKRLFTYAEVGGDPVETSVKKINAYLLDGENIFIERRDKPLCDVPEMHFGNMPLDGGHLLFTEKEKKDFLRKEPKAKKFIKPLISAREFLNGGRRWCLWLVNVKPDELRSMPEVMKRINAVKKFRMASTAAGTREKAALPYLFVSVNNPADFLVVPRVSSERRKYIPMALMNHPAIVGDTCMLIPKASFYHFAILTSAMHMAWMRYVCGRLKSDYRYSKDIVYNNFPWPSSTEKQKEKVEEAARNVLDARAKFSEDSLADLYDPLAMPAVLARAHKALDKAVDAAYGRTFANDSERVAYLFELYQQLSGELFRKEQKRGKGRKT